MIYAFDSAWVYRLNSWMTDPLLARIFTFIALWGVLYFVIVALWLWYASTNAKTALLHKRTVVMIVLAAMVALLVANFFDVVTPRPRPFASLDGIIAVNVFIDAASFPSLHVAMTFAFATMLLLLKYRVLGWVSVVLAAVVGLSRVVVGVHFPTDVIGGVVVGIASAVVVFNEAGWLRHYLPDNRSS